MNWQVRAADLEDVACLPGIELAAGRMFPAGRVPDPEETHSIGELAGYVADRGAWVAVEFGAVAGFAIARPLDGALHVYELAVDPRFGRRGMGTALMHATMEDARCRGLGRVTLTTFADLPWNAPFYRRLGFAILTGAALSASLTAILQAEAANGLTQRVAMAWGDVPSP